MTEFQGLVKDAPKFASMERGELVAHAYAMYAAGTKTNDDNAKLRELAKEAMKVAYVLCGECLAPCDVCGVDKCGTGCKLEYIDKLARELGIEVDR